MKHRLLVLMLLCLVVPIVSYVQENALVEGGVWVTTQDFSSLRVGPGRAFNRIAVVPPAATLPAIGRTQDSRWIQVEYEGQQGWISYLLLVWSGDIVQLPVDGINPPPMVRLIGIMGVTTRETILYSREVTPEHEIGTLPAGTPVEITARLGESGFFWVQIRHAGELYWTGSWNIRFTSGDYRRALDTSYLYVYGRLSSRLEGELQLSASSLSQIETIWLRLRAGENVSCGGIPPFASRRFADADVQREPIFAPAVVALDAAIADINATIAMFEDACSRAGDQFFLTEADVRSALAQLDSARRNLVLGASLLVSLQARDPLVAGR